MARPTDRTAPRSAATERPHRDRSYLSEMPAKPAVRVVVARSVRRGGSSAAMTGLNKPLTRQVSCPLTLRSDAGLFKSHSSCQSPIIPLQIHSRSAITLTAPRTIHKSLIRLGGLACLWQVYAHQAYLPYIQSPSRSGLLEPRIETTLQIVSILIC
jgi:hypothetical protein